MAERSLDKKAQSVVSQTKRRPASTKKTERSRRVASRPQEKSASGPTKKHTDDLFAKEEQYKLLNAQLEAKTAEIVRQAEQLMKEQTEVLSKPLSNILLTYTEDEEDSRLTKPQRCTEQHPGVKMVTQKKATSTSQAIGTGKQEKEPHQNTSKVSQVEDSTAFEDSDDFFLATTIQNMEEKMTDAVVHENAVDDVTNAGANVGSVVSDAQMRVLKAKLRIMQEELDELSSEYYKRDDENSKLNAKMKEIEEDRARLQKTTSIQQTQIEKHRALAEESAKKCDGLQLQVSGLHKEIENLNRSHKQAAAVHGTVEVRLNRALEEVERLKTQLNKMEQTNKMHFEAAKLLSFTEEEFMKALDWGKS
ncbi:testis-expressed protein 9 isoform X2 [Acanthochromis polyacanthus]|uniref:testis-expressed protein 9 isoform X2 n=1 Tax=Acanthochromis polyacanthus TaxID=80966 RepID=UPI000B8F4A18|nr:testis-expressed protein 9 isoform X2 [Acanthochromis polyacanthus]